MTDRDTRLDELTRGVRRRVNAGKNQGELFARSRADWYERVDKIADAVKRSAKEHDGKLLTDAVCSLAAACYFATLPDGGGDHGAGALE